MRRVLGMDIHRTFAEVVIWEQGQLRRAGRVDMTRTALEGFGKTLQPCDEVVVEAPATRWRWCGFSRHSSRVSSLLIRCRSGRSPMRMSRRTSRCRVSCDAPCRWVPARGVDTAGRDRAPAAARGAPQPSGPSPHAEQERSSFDPACASRAALSTCRSLRPPRSSLVKASASSCRRGRGDRPTSTELDRLAEDLELLDREVAQSGLEDPNVKRLLTITGVNVRVAAGLVAAIGDIRRFSSPQKLVSYVGLNPRVRQSGLSVAHHGRISKAGRSHARSMLVEAAWATA